MGYKFEGDRIYSPNSVQLVYKISGMILYPFIDVIDDSIIAIAIIFTLTTLMIQL